MSHAAMPCGWGCGKSLTASEMSEHFTSCPSRPTEGVSRRAVVNDERIVGRLRQSLGRSKFQYRRAIEAHHVRKR